MGAVLLHSAGRRIQHPAGGLSVSLQAEIEPIPPVGEHPRWIEDHLGWAEGVARASFGPRGVEFAGLALAEAISSFDGRCPLTAWARKNIQWVISRNLREIYGREGGPAQLSDEMVAAGVAQAVDAEPVDEIDGEQVVHGLRTLDHRTRGHRWEGLGAALGGFTATQAKRVHRSRWLPRWASVEEAVDACLLFGGSLWQTRPGKGQPAIEFGRALGETQALAWMMVVLEATMPELGRLELAVGADSVTRYGRLVYRTSPHLAFRRSLGRWYAGGKCTPPDVVTDRTLAAWLSGGFYGAGPVGPVELKSQGLRVESAEPIVRDIRARGIGCTIRTSPKSRGKLAAAIIAIDPLHRPIAEQWLAERVPRFVWTWKNA